MRNVLHVKKTMFIVEGSLLTHNVYLLRHARQRILSEIEAHQRCNFTSLAILLDLVRF
jgi:hypothetical protein